MEKAYNFSPLGSICNLEGVLSQKPTPEEIEKFKPHVCYEHACCGCRYRSVGEGIKTEPTGLAKYVIREGMMRCINPRPSLYHRDIWETYWQGECSVRLDSPDKELFNSDFPEEFPGVTPETEAIISPHI